MSGEKGISLTISTVLNIIATAIMLIGGYVRVSDRLTSLETKMELLITSHHLTNGR